ncbi:unnamed protein product [Owenia fusiformis]|uniref:FGGY carbohydrate kinase domain-containing protein n=1 Tax=Owenia fusiformis TaxID=6347 RepID=A0A8S4N0W6_OWEFU|nr:unnamed protein product [Owenia fusiformis]
MSGADDTSPLYIGVDVGTRSVRAALFNKAGLSIKTSVKPITIWNPKPNFYEQSSDNIWASCCAAIKDACLGVSPDRVKGIGVDATCSLVVLDKNDQPLSVSPTGMKEQNVVMWMDHRAQEQAQRINLTNHDVLKYVGGAISLEMEPPKLLWLKENMNESCWNKAGSFFELPDFLTFKATGCTTRSLCSMVCKWSYCISEGDTSKQGWSDTFWQQIGLDDLAEANYAKIDQTILPPGTACGSGLSAKAAGEMGLNPGTPVATSIIDAHAGAIGCLGCDMSVLQSSEPYTNRLILISGTSMCHMVVNKNPVSVPGVWGPFYSAIIPGLWGHEGGQSATGKLIDHVIEGHAAYGELKELASERKQHAHDVLNSKLDEMASESNVELGQLTKQLHIWPDFHGNRSPIADPTLTGMISGLTLANGIPDLALLYLSCLQALAYGTRQIVEALTANGYSIDVVCMCGGLRKNKLFVMTHADVLGLPILLPEEEESVLLGSAILGAYASGDFPNLQTCMKTMGGRGKLVQPNATSTSFHEKKYRVFLKMLKDQLQYRAMME